MNYKIGIIAGGGDLPSEIVEMCMRTKKKCYIAALDDQSYRVDYKAFNIGQVGEILNYFNINNITDIMLAGSVHRPNLTSLKVDKVGAKLLAQIMKKKILGDDSLLKIIAEFIEDQGFRIISAIDLIDNTAYEEFTRYKPSKRENGDIEIGFRAITKIGELDIGQAVVVEDGYILGVEAAEGTDNLIKRCAILRKNETGGILIKSLKPNQDLRLDIPTIGPDTIMNLVENKYKGLAIKKNEVIILNPQKCYEIANDNKLFIACVHP